MPGRLVNNLILLVVLVAGLGIIAALAMGTYFALQPKGDARRSQIRQHDRPGADRFIYTPPPFGKDGNSSHKLEEQVTPAPSTPFGARPKTKATQPPRKSAPTRLTTHPSTLVYVESDKTTKPIPKTTTTPLKTVKTTTTTKKTTTTTRSTPVPKKSTAEFARLVLPENVENEVSSERHHGHGAAPLDPVAPISEQPVITFPPASLITGQVVLPSQTPEPAEFSPEQSSDASERRVAISGHAEVRQRGRLVPQGESSKEEDKALEKHLLGYQKIAGISYRNGYLYVPSYVNGKVSVLSTPDMNTLIEYDCAGCSIYDIAALSTGDMIAVLGRGQQMVKIDPTGREVKRATLDFATKGLAVNGYNEIFVLSRTHTEIFVYNKDLEPIALVKIPGKAQGDCNFLAVNDSDVIFVSCQEAVYVFTVNSDPIMKILPPRGVSYGVGMDLDSRGNILVVRRGQGVLDVYDPQGHYLEAVGEGVDTLWSDIAAGEEHLYVVDYIDAKIKVFKYV